MTAAARFHALKVADIRRETPEAVSIAFDVPDGLRADFHFRPGQYLTLRADLDGEDCRRSYSICTAPEDGEMRVAVKEMADGRFSRFANRALSVGDVIEVMPPAGRFTPAIEAGAVKTYLGVAAGSGITPLMSIIRAVLRQEPGSEFILIYGNKTSQSVIFKTELEDLKDRYLGRLSVFHVLSREANDIDLLHGRLTAGRIERLTRSALGSAGIDDAYLCGPEEVIGEARKALAALGVPGGRIHDERFVADGAIARQRREEAVARGGADVPLSVHLDGATHNLSIRPGETVLEAAAREGVDLPHSCTGGMCCTCRARVTAGEVAMDQNYSLEPWELQAGFVLTCQSRPVKGPVAVDFDVN